MRQWLWAPLAGALVLAVAAPTVMAGSNPEAVIGLHIVSQEQATGTCDAYLPFGCQQFVTNVTDPGDYNIYVTVSKLDTVGLAGLQFGVIYDAAPNSGFDVANWYTCGDLDFPMSGWPAANTGTLMTWEPTFNCQGDPTRSTRPVCAGVFQVSVTGQADAFTVIPRPADGKAKVADCLSAENDLTNSTPSRLGIVTFGAEPGYNPCSVPTGVERTTWGSIKTLYEK